MRPERIALPSVVRAQREGPLPRTKLVVDAQGVAGRAESHVDVDAALLDDLADLEGVHRVDRDAATTPSDVAFDQSRSRVLGRENAARRGGQDAKDESSSHGSWSVRDGRP